MRNSTPFFAAFASLLFGRAPRSRLQKLLGQWPQRPSINQYMETFGEFIPQTLLGRSKEKVNSRQRIFSPLVTFWAFLAQVLERGSSCRDALQRISAWWQLHFPDQGSPSSDTSGYCQARARLDEAVLQQIGTQVAEQLERQVTNEQLWLGRRVKIVDGTGLSMPDTAANQLEWPQNSGQKPGCGFPQLKVVGLFCLQQRSASAGGPRQQAPQRYHARSPVLAFTATRRDSVGRSRILFLSGHRPAAGPRRRLPHATASGAWEAGLSPRSPARSERSDSRLAQTTPASASLEQRRV